MQREKLESLLHEMTLTEKIDQLVMLDNSSFEKDAFITGPQAKLGLTEDVMSYVRYAFIQRRFW